MDKDLLFTNIKNNIEEEMIESSIDIIEFQNNGIINNNIIICKLELLNILYNLLDNIYIFNDDKINNIIKLYNKIKQ